MKAIITIFLVLTANLAMARPNIVISQSCNHRYVDGVKFQRPNGQIVKKCLNKSTLPRIYNTHVKAKCASTHAEGRWSISSNAFNYKTCTNKKDLGEIYATYAQSECVDGYSSDGVAIFPHLDFSYKFCVRELR